MSLRSRTPSPFGEKNFVIFVTRTTGGEPFRRCAAKNAENVAPTSTMKTTRAKSVTGCGSPSADLVLAEDDDDLRRPAGRERLRVDRAHLGRLQAPGDVPRGGPRALGVVDDRGGAALCVVAQARLVAGGDQLLLDLRGEAVGARPVEHRHV